MVARHGALVRGQLSLVSGWMLQHTGTAGTAKKFVRDVLGGLRGLCVSSVFVLGYWPVEAESKGREGSASRSWRSSLFHFFTSRLFLSSARSLPARAFALQTTGVTTAGDSVTPVLHTSPLGLNTRKRGFQRFWRKSGLFRSGVQNSAHCVPAKESRKTEKRKRRFLHTHSERWSQLCEMQPRAWSAALRNAATAALLRNFCQVPRPLEPSRRSGPT
mgnify:CR=1 FL=1